MRQNFFTSLLLLMFSVIICTAQDASFITKVFGSDTTSGDVHGRSVAIYGDTAVVGGRFNSTDGFHAGAVYIYMRHQGGENNWGEVKRLSSPGGLNAWFGQAVDINRDLIIVGAKEEKRAYLFFRHAGGFNNWGLVKILAPAVDDGEYGHEVAIYGDYAIVSEIFNSDHERVYIYKFNEGGPNNWGLIKTLVNTDPFSSSDDLFGYDLAIDNDILVIAENSYTSPSGVHIYYKDFGGQDNWGLVKQFGFSDDIFGFVIHSVDIFDDRIICGSREFSAAYILERHYGGLENWGIALKYLTPGLEDFGANVSIHSNTALVGSNFYVDPSSSIISGGVYRFARNGSAGSPWQLQEVVVPPDVAPNKRFGVAVDQSFNKKTIVGAYLDTDRGFNAGAAYLYSLGEDTGTVKINIFPADAVKKGALWRFSFSAKDNWRPNGNAADGVSGNCFVIFKDVNGYKTPGNIKLDVQGGDFVEMDVTYVPDTPEQLPDGRLWVRLLPDKVRDMNARWRIVGTDNWYPTDTEIALQPGSYWIQVEPASGYTKPKRKQIIIESGKKSWLRFHYQRNP